MEAKDGDHCWENRRPVMVSMLKEYQPDIFGVQEGLRPQLDYLIDSLTDYACFGEGRDGLDKSEHVAIFYNVKKIYCIEGHTFWLSETPEIPGSKSWETSLPRLVTWGRFQLKSTGTAFYLYNTHFDHRSEQARQQSAKLVWSRIKAKNDITFLTGDFNCTEQSFAWKYLTGDPEIDEEDKGDLIDLWHSAEKQINPVSTYHGYKGALEANERIDWILARPALKVLQAETVVYQKNGFYPSDHFAVYAEVTID